MIDEKFYLDKKLLAMTKKEIKSYRMKNPFGCQEALWLFWGDVGCHIYP